MLLETVIQTLLMVTINYHFPQAIVDFSFVSINNNTEKITLSKYFTLSLLGCTDKNIVHHLLFRKIIKVSL